MSNFLWAVLLHMALSCSRTLSQNRQMMMMVAFAMHYTALYWRTNREQTEYRTIWTHYELITTNSNEWILRKMCAPKMFIHQIELKATNQLARNIWAPNIKSYEWCVWLWIAALQCVSVRTIIIIIIIVIVIISLDGRSVDATNFITSKKQNGNKHIRARRQNFSYCWRFEQLRCSNSSVVVSRTFEYRFLRSKSHHQFVCRILNL